MSIQDIWIMPRCTDGHAFSYADAEPSWVYCHANNFTYADFVAITSYPYTDDNGPATIAADRNLRDGIDEGRS